MNLILHQFTTNVRHFRGRLLALWVCFAAEAILTSSHSLPGEGVGIATFLLDLGQALFALALVASLVQADALVGTSAAWLARPLRREHLFWAKTIFIVLCLFTPWLVMQVFGWTLRGYSAHLGLVAAEQGLMFNVTVVAIVAVLAALTRNLPHFFLAVGIAVAGLFAASLLVEMMEHAGWLHQVRYDWRQEQERSNSAFAVAWLALGLGALTAWLAQARLNPWRFAVACLAAGFLACPVITAVWYQEFSLAAAHSVRAVEPGRGRDQPPNGRQSAMAGTLAGTGQSRVCRNGMSP